MPGVHELVRLDDAEGWRAVVAAVVEAQPLVVAAGRGERGDTAASTRGPGAGERHRGDLQRLQPVPQMAGQDVLQLGQRPLRALLDAGTLSAAAARRPRATATASSSSSRSGGSAAPTPSR